MSAKSKIFLLVILVIIALLVLLRGPKKIPTAQNTPKAPQADSHTETQAPPGVPSFARGPATVPGSTARDKANLTPVDVVMEPNGSTAVSVKVAAKGVCYPADLDAMEVVFKDSNSLIFSMEPMDGKSKAFTKSLSFDEIRKGTAFRVPVSMDKVAVYGLFICGDKSGKKSCVGKKAMDINMAAAGKNKDEAQNGLFYYQFALIGSQLQSVYSGVSKGVKSLIEHLKTVEGIKDPDVFAQLDKASQLMHVIQSIPPYTSKSGDTLWIEIPVAALDKSTCY